MSENELKSVVGGSKWGVVALISSAISFILGVIDGLINPLACGE